MDIVGKIEVLVAEALIWSWILYKLFLHSSHAEQRHRGH